MVIKIIEHSVSRADNEVTHLDFHVVFISDVRLVLAQTFFAFPQNLTQTNTLLNFALLSENFAVVFGWQVR